MALRIGVAGAMALVVALALSAPVAPATRPFGVLVLARNHEVVQVFDAAKCTRKNGDFDASARAGDDTLHVVVDGFKGFRTYRITLAEDAYVQVNVGIRQAIPALGPGAHFYTNLNVPPFPSPGFGQLRFAKGGTLMGVGFSPMYSRNFTDAVTVTGVLKCTYPKKKPRR